MAQIGDTLKYLRKRENITQTDLANALEVSKSTIGMYETNRREPDLETLEAIADYFNVDMNFLIGSEQKEKPVTNNGNELSEDAARVLEIMKQLPPDKLHILESVAITLRNG